MFYRIRKWMCFYGSKINRFGFIINLFQFLFCTKLIDLKPSYVCIYIIYAYDKCIKNMKFNQILFNKKFRHAIIHFRMKFIAEIKRIIVFRSILMGYWKFAKIAINNCKTLFWKHILFWLYLIFESRVLIVKLVFINFWKYIILLRFNYK